MIFFPVRNRRANEGSKKRRIGLNTLGDHKMWEDVTSWETIGIGVILHCALFYC